MIWTDAQLAMWSNDAVGQIAIDVSCIFARECVATQVGVSVITLPSYVRTVRRVTWRGRSLDAVNWEEMTMLTPATIFVAPGSSANVEATASRPLYYTMHPTNLWDIRLYPCPNESFATNGEPNVYSPTANSPSCIVDYMREPDGTVPTLSIPAYILRRTQKAYVLWKAFAAEGVGQNLKASQYYMMKYQFLIDKWREINESCFIGKKYSVEDGMLSIDGFKYPKPFLPANFERVIFG